MKKKIKMLCLALLSVWFVLGFCIAVQPCALCDSKPYHGLCLVDRQAGQVYEFTIYDNDPFAPGELSEQQTNGTFSFLEMGELIGYRNTAGNTAGVSVPDTPWLGWNGGFCLSCEKLMRNNAAGRYLIADLSDPKELIVFPIADGAVYESRCYGITVMKDTKNGKLDIMVTGQLDI